MATLQVITIAHQRVKEWGEPIAVRIEVWIEQSGMFAAETLQNEKDNVAFAQYRSRGYLVRCLIRCRDIGTFRG